VRLGLVMLVLALLPGSSTQFFRIQSVIDGDTVVLANGRHVRLVQVDAPEVFPVAECYGAASRTALRRLLPPGTRVRIESDPRLDQVDRYGRLLRYVFRGPLNVNLELVREGAATPYFYRHDRGAYAGALERGAAKARGARLGLWGACPRTPFNPNRGADTGPPP
jgi:endonuclease YncB( thermonuclease family)